MGRHHRDAAAAKSMLSSPSACAVCGKTIGKHRYGTDQCPNPRWTPGNGEPQWLTSVFSDDATAVLSWRHREEAHQ